MAYKKIEWTEITVEQYIEIQDLLEDDLTSTEFLLELGDIFFELPEDIPVRKLKDLKGALSFIKDEVPKSSTKQIEEYPVKRFQSLSYSEFIELDVILSTKSEQDSIEKSIRILYGLPKDFDILSLPIVEVYGTQSAYIDYREDVLTRYQSVFTLDDNEEEIDEEPKEKPNPRKVWLGTLFGLANGDITKAKEILALGHIFVFNWVSTAESLKSRSPKQIE